MKRINHLSDESDKRGLALEFSSVIVGKDVQPRGTDFYLKEGPALNRFTFDSEMIDSVQIGDSITKKKNKNNCTVYKKDGRIIDVKFIYVQPN